MDILYRKTGKHIYIKEYKSWEPVLKVPRVFNLSIRGISVAIKCYIYGLRGGPFFRTDFSIRTLKFGWVRRNGLFKLKRKIIRTPKNQCFLCKKLKKLILIF